MPHMNMTHEEDPKELILRELGDIEKFKVFHNEVVVAVIDTGVNVSHPALKDSLWVNKQSVWIACCI